MDRLIPGLRGRLLLIVAVAILPGVGLALYNTAEQREEAVGRIVAEARQVAQTAAQQQAHLIAGARQVVRSLARQEPVRALDAEGCREVVSAELKGLDYYANILVTTPEGKVFCSALPLPSPVNLRDRPGFDRTLTARDVVITDYLIGPVTGRPIIAVAAPVVEPTGAVRAIVSLAVDLAWVNRLLALTPLPAGATLTMLDRKGVVLARHPDPERWVGKVLPEGDLRQALSSAREGVFEALGLGGLPRLLTIAPVPGEAGAPIAFVIAGIPKEVAFAQVERRRTRSLTVLGLVGVLAGLGAWVVAGLSVRRPVEALLGATARFKAGERGVRLGPRYPGGELGELARAFDDTAAALEAREAELREARETLQAVIDNAALSIVVYDLDGHVKLWNPGATRIFGWSAEEVLHRPPPFVPREDSATFGGFFGRAAQGEVVLGIEVRRLTRDGTLIDVSAAIAPLRDAEGRVQGVIAIHQDITGQKRLEAHRRLLFAALDAAANAVNITDSEGRITWVNPAFTRLTGFSAEEALGQTPRLLKSGRHDQAFYAQLWETILAGRVWTGEIVNRRKDGSLYTEEQTITPVRGEGGEITHFVSIHQDVTARRRAEETLRHTEKLAAMGALLAGVAHELNNPLAVALGHAQILRRALGAAPLAARAAKISQAAERCARIVGNFLALARQRPPERQEVRLNQVARDAVELLAYQLRVATVEVDLSLADDLPPLWGDPHQLHQVVVNLVSNALDAMREAPPPRRLTLTTRHDPARGRISLEVADTGPGIPQEIQQTIFEPFFTTKPEGRGTGLGLSLCQGIVEGHGGVIRLESQPGQGARFVVELPLVARPGGPEPETVAELPPIRGKAILVVDDESEVADLLAEQLSLEGHRVDTAANGHLALDKLRTRAYDLILSDLRMPELDGPGLYRELERRDPQLCRRVIFITGDTLGPNVTAFLDATGRPNLSKPFVWEEVLRVVRQELGAQRPA